MDKLEPARGYVKWGDGGEDYIQPLREKIDEIIDWINATEKDLRRLTGA